MLLPTDLNWLFVPACLALGVLLAFGANALINRPPRRKRS